MDLIKFVIDVLTAEGETGSTAYDIAYVFVGPWLKIAEGASQLLGMFV
ncbi:hypothetical protein M3701_07415 [Corynebacterium mucifaciens]|nr:hypothetical protein [Corynebacterium mucifaciens]